MEEKTENSKSPETHAMGKYWKKKTSEGKSVNGGVVVVGGCVGLGGVGVGFVGVVGWGQMSKGMGRHQWGLYQTLTFRFISRGESKAR